MFSILLALAIGGQTPPLSLKSPDGSAGLRTSADQTSGGESRAANLATITAQSALELAEACEKRSDRACAAYHYRLYLRRAPVANDSLLIAERVAVILLAEQENGRGLLEADAPGALKATIDGQEYTSFPLAVFLRRGRHDLLVKFQGGNLKQGFEIATGKVTHLSLEPVQEETTPAPTSAIQSPESIPGPPSPTEERKEVKGWTLIAHRAPKAEMSAQRIREIFSAERVVSEDGEVARVILGPLGSPARETFLSEFLGKSEVAFRTAWTKLTFRGGGVRPPIELDNEAEVVKAVAQQPGSFGVVSSSLETPGVTRIKIVQ
ncbi:MAG TPA: hypothetical protein VF947_00010 [Myxococcales bacterium]